MGITKFETMSNVQIHGISNSQEMKKMQGIFALLGSSTAFI
jgi:hypothetical protein